VEQGESAKLSLKREQGSGKASERIYLQLLLPQKRMFVNLAELTNQTGGKK
jgi:hypothetical protein